MASPLGVLTGPLSCGIPGQNSGLSVQGSLPSISACQFLPLFLKRLHLPQGLEGKQKLVVSSEKDGEGQTQRVSATGTRDGRAVPVPPAELPRRCAFALLT